MKTDKRYVVFNKTDGIFADPRTMTLVEARAFVRGFPARFAHQGYYLTANRDRIRPEAVVLEILDEHWEPVLAGPASDHADPLS